MNQENQELINIVTKVLEEKYAHPIHSVAAILRTKEGHVITSTNIDHFSGYVCAETSALDQAINQGHYDFDIVAAVRMDEDGMIGIANMCGKCRQIFHDYSPDINVIVTDGNKNFVKNIDEILPFSFKRQQNKIHTVIEGIKRK